MRHIVDEYKDWQPKYASYELKDFNLRDALRQAILEMVTEAGEVLDLQTKADRKKEPVNKDKLLDELGDTFWGLVGVMNKAGFTWKQVVNHNMAKLEARNK